VPPKDIIKLDMIQRYY
jgi:hypothetical protein